MTITRLSARTTGWLAAAALGVSTLAVGATTVSADQPVGANNQPTLYGMTYALQNNFSSFGELIPFFDPQGGRIGPDVEIGSGYIYDIDFGRRSISMSWNTDPAFDMFEPYVAALAGLDQETASMLPLADEYWITFSKPISDLVFTADPDQTLVPNLRIEDDHTLVISIPGGTDIGDGFDAVIDISRG